MRRKKINTKKIKNKKRGAVLEVVTRSDRETKKLGELLAKTTIIPPPLQGGVGGGGKFQTATVISLEGDLGSGKTTFAKGFAKGLGICETIQSPTFVIAKMYQFFRTKNAPHPPTPLSLRRRGGKNKRMPFSNGEVLVFVHIDAYRIKAKDLPAIGWDEFIKNARNIVLVEWGDRIRTAFPKNPIKISFQHRKKNERIISFFC